MPLILPITPQIKKEKKKKKKKIIKKNLIHHSNFSLAFLLSMSASQFSLCITNLTFTLDAAALRKFFALDSAAFYYGRLLPHLILV